MQWRRTNSFLSFTESTPVVVVLPVVSTTTEPTLTSTVRSRARAPFKAESLKLVLCAADLGYFGKVGMRHYHLLRNHYWRPVINTDKLVTLLPKDQAQTSGDLVPVIDTVAHGYGKVLAKGRIPGNKPLIVKARYVSERAEEKIKQAGGIVKIVA